jgi:hypothetical protein
MSRTKSLTAVVLLSAAALISAPGVLAASPQQIYNDYADNGRLDGTYSQQDLEKALNNAVVQAYGKGSQGGLKPAVEKQQNNNNNKSNNNNNSSNAGGNAGAAVVKSGGGLPFTGLDLSLMLIGAIGLVMLGAAFRRVARQRQ